MSISYEQWILMADYLNATNLLVDCLKLAVVSDRTAIEDRLLLPPS
ncbi:MAG: hypothetical protein M9930_08635 [Anaerolineae bacterium]|nr:hypothetical protein [Anaerolineae bacterium]